MIDPATAATTDTACRHCGQAILHTRLSDGHGGTFCCQGCLEVHAVLGGRDGGRYYELLERGGRKAPKAVVGAEYAAFLATLDDPDVLASLGRWEGGRHAVNLESRELVCAACGWLAESLLGDTAGVATYEVDFLRGRIFLAYDPARASLQSILRALAGFGYRFRPEAADAPRRPRADRALLARIAVSGACFGNAMAFAAANYLGAFQGISAEWARTFGIMGFAVSLPAAAYGAFPFYAGAWRASRASRFSVDITVTLGLAAAFTASLASLVDGRAGNFSDSLAGLVFFLLIGRWAVQRFESGLALNGRWFDALRKGKVRVLRNGLAVPVDCTAVAAGETVEVEPGDYLPLDGVLESEQAWLDTGLLTGESRPLHARAGDPVFAGTLALKARLRVLVTGTAGYTRIDRLGRELDHLASARRETPDALARVAAGFTATVLVAAALTFILHAGNGMLSAAAAASSVLIISCACALALTGPICRGLGLKRAQALGYHFKSQRALEALAAIRCVLFDKTGTLTFTHRRVSGWDWAPAWRDDTARRAAALRTLRELAHHSLHPVAVSLVRALEGVEGASPALVSVREIPHFGLVAKGGAGSPFFEIGLCRTGAWIDRDGAFAGLGWRTPSSGRAPAPEAALNADSVLFLDGEAAAFIRFTDEIKPEVPAMLKALADAGVAAVLLSGDSTAKVEEFARRSGIGVFHGGLDPEEKGDWAKRYQARYGRCLAVGDGFNDSLLFGTADLAMAIQGGAVDLSAGTDILATGDRPASLPRLLALSHGVRRAIRACWWVSGVYNAAAIGAAMTGLVTPLMAAVLMPLSSLSLCLAAWLTIPRR